MVRCGGRIMPKVPLLCEGWSIEANSIDGDYFWRLVWILRGQLGT